MQGHLDGATERSGSGIRGGVVPQGFSIPGMDWFLQSAKLPVPGGYRQHAMSSVWTSPQKGTWVRERIKDHDRRPSAPPIYIAALTVLVLYREWWTGTPAAGPTHCHPVWCRRSRSSWPCFVRPQSLRCGSTSDCANVQRRLCHNGWTSPLHSTREAESLLQ